MIALMLQGCLELSQRRQEMSCVDYIISSIVVVRLAARGVLLHVMVSLKCDKGVIAAQ